MRSGNLHPGLMKTFLLLWAMGSCIDIEKYQGYDDGKGLKSARARTQARVLQQQQPRVEQLNHKKAIMLCIYAEKKPQEGMFKSPLKALLFRMLYAA